MSAYDIHAWVEFGVEVASAAAVLKGLVFVAVSINLERVLAVPGVSIRAHSAAPAVCGQPSASARGFAPPDSIASGWVETTV